MSTIKISLPETLKSFVDSQVADCDYTSSSEYVRELVRREHNRVHLREMLFEGAASPVSETVWNPEYFEALRDRVKSREVFQHPNQHQKPESRI